MPLEVAVRARSTTTPADHLRTAPACSAMRAGAPRRTGQRALSRAGAQIPPARLRRPDRPGGDGPHPANAFATGRIAHAFMLTGVRGVGKTTTARIIARALNCIGPDGTGEPDHPTLRRRARHCRAIIEGRHMRRAWRWTPPAAPASTTCARSSTACAIAPVAGALQGLHHRRSAHAVDAAPSTRC